MQRADIQLFRCGLKAFAGGLFVGVQAAVGNFQ